MIGLLNTTLHIFVLIGCGHWICFRWYYSIFSRLVSDSFYYSFLSWNKEVCSLVLASTLNFIRQHFGCSLYVGNYDTYSFCVLIFYSIFCKVIEIKLLALKNITEASMVWKVQPIFLWGQRLLFSWTVAIPNQSGVSNLWGKNCSVEIMYILIFIVYYIGTPFNKLALILSLLLFSILALQILAVWWLVDQFILQNRLSKFSCYLVIQMLLLWHFECLAYWICIDSSLCCLKGNG